MQYLTIYNTGLLVLLALFTGIGFWWGRRSRDGEVERLEGDFIRAASDLIKLDGIATELRDSRSSLQARLDNSIRLNNDWWEINQELRRKLAEKEAE